MEAISIQLNKLIKESGLSLRELQELTGIPHSAIQRYATGTTNNIPIGRLEKLARVLGTNAASILGWNKSSNKYRRGSVLPVLGTVAAGNGEYAEESVLGYETVDEKYISDEYYYLQVAGESMSPEIKDGDFVLVHRQEEVESGTLGIVIVDGEDGVVKKVVYGDGSITLVSFNPYFPPRVFEGEEAQRVRVVGRVIESKRKFV